MSLVERLSTPPVDPTKQFCDVGKLLHLLEGADPALQEYMALARALSDSQWQASDIARALAAEGHPVNLRHIRQHRRGEHSEANCMDAYAGVIQ